MSFTKIILLHKVFQPILPWLMYIGEHLDITFWGCLEPPKGQQISKAIFLETPLPKKRTKYLKKILP